jgi:hypothetical protein
MRKLIAAVSIGTVGVIGIAAPFKAAAVMEGAENNCHALERKMARAHLKHNVPADENPVWIAIGTKMIETFVDGSKGAMAEASVRKELPSVVPAQVGCSYAYFTVPEKRMAQVAQSMANDIFN